MRYDVISTYFYVILTRIIKRCRHEILIKKKKKKRKKIIFYKNKKMRLKIRMSYIFVYMNFYRKK